MAYKISEECTTCGVCVDECPVQAISEGDEIFVIDPSTCIECEGHYDEPHCAEVCPVGACVPDPEHPKEKTEE
jgi:ferredoxin